ncbi:MAG: LVIVD repeat-containing protein, partial [Vicinamibacterales bacterium]
MRSAATGLLCCSAVLIVVALEGGAQERAAGAAASTDPRVGLKAGLRDAGEAAHNMERLATLPKPDGFFDPKAPAGDPTPPERDRSAPAAGESGAAPGAEGAASGDTRSPNRLSFANSDLAFRGNHLVMGNYHGFNTYDIENARRPRLLASVVCPGGQGDVSIHGNLLFMSVEQTRGRLDCGMGGVQAPVSAERFRGIRIFDISDVKKPRQVAAVQTCRGSHTHTLVTDPNDKANLYVYGSGTSSVRSAEELAGCSGLDPKEDPNTALFSIDVIKVPLAAPDKAAIVNRPRIFADPTTGAISGLWQGGNHGPGTQTSRRTNQCHDITVFPEIGLAAGACSGNGILLDISDPVNPVRLDHVVDKSFAYWHSATFNNDGTKIVFTDEWGGGTRPRCRATDLLTWGADAIFDVVDRKLQFRSYYKIPAPQTEQENCVAHNGSPIPVPGRDIMVQAWYQGGLSVFDFTDSTRPVEIAFFDRGPIDAKQLITGGYWSTYWYNGHIYGAEIARGVDVFRLTPSEHLSQNEIDAATLVRANEFNAQQQSRIVWPPSAVVARAYLDQLTRMFVLKTARGAG